MFEICLKYAWNKFLTNLPNPVIPKSHCAKEWFTFCEDIKKVSTCTIVNLWVPIQFTFYLPAYHSKKHFILLSVCYLNIIVPKSWSKSYKNRIENILEKEKSCTRFLLQSTFYDQIDDVTMCTHFGHVLANFFIATNKTV